jgi:hypothetical protein
VPQREALEPKEANQWACFQAMHGTYLEYTADHVSGGGSFRLMWLIGLDWPMFRGILPSVALGSPAHSPPGRGTGGGASCAKKGITALSRMPGSMR